MKLDYNQKLDLFKYLTSFFSENKQHLIEEVIQSRTRHITVVLEDIFQPQNASAVLRTCDCMGVQDVHIIENNNKFNINPDVELGAAKWLNIYNYNKLTNNTLDAIEQLKDRNYKIVATTPHKDDILLEELDISDKLALFFGTEKDGLSNEVLNNADYFVKIPMSGFTESFNISVSAAITIYSLTTRLKKNDINWQLSEEEKIDLKIQWASKIIKMSDKIIENYLVKNRLKQN
jgi:tRNA (guanosine-2'-O-)-methyltransferase